jgi:protein-S-isoprenylcysteine O-methyltransferase Ste14
VRWLEHRVPPPVVALAAAALMWLLARFVPLAGASLPGGAIVACGVAVAGLGIAVAGVPEFRRARTTVDPFHPAKASALVRSGIFRRTRNPMYLGMSVILLGWMLWLAEPLTLAGPLIFVLYMNRFQIGPEEKALQTLFGEEFADYQRTVRRWL